MKMIYVAGPYRSPRKAQMLANVALAWEYARRLWAQGHAVICPHANTFEMQGEGVTVEDILNGDFEIIGRCDEIHILPRWETSVGTKMEIEVAKEMGIKIIYVHEATHP